MAVALDKHAFIATIRIAFVYRQPYPASLPNTQSHVFTAYQKPQADGPICQWPGAQAAGLESGWSDQCRQRRAGHLGAFVTRQAAVQFRFAQALLWARHLLVHCSR